MTDPEIQRVLVVCTGNQCRSPMAAAALSAELRDRGSAITVVSAGFVSDGVPCPPEVIDIMGSSGLDVSQHRSRRLSPALADSADLIVGMTRQHMIDLALIGPETWSRSFTVAEILRRGEVVGGRAGSEPLAGWTRRVNAGRVRSAILGLPLADDIPDPIGKSLKQHLRTRDLMLDFARRLGVLIAPV